MTMGQRIAERRKLLGLSQEALGERMGVSRQAISKWEADGAIPEIDKLIGLSKLFEVSVGWLLGTEDSCEETREAEQSQGLNDEQLKMVEEIVRRYQQAQPKPKRDPALVCLCLCCAVVALIVSVVSLDKANRQLPDYEYQLSHLSNSNASIQSQLYDLSGRLDEMAEGEKLLVEYTAEITALPDWETAQIDFCAVPKTWQAGDKAYLSLRKNGLEQQKADCTWDGVAYSVKMDAAYGEYECYFVLCQADGTQVQNNVSDALYGMPYELEPECDAQICEVGWDLNAKTISLDSFALWLGPPWIMAKGTDQNLAWTQVDLVVKQNGKEIERLDLLEVCDNVMEPAQEVTGIFGSSESAAVEAVPELYGTTDPYMQLERFDPICFTLSQLNEGDRFELEIEAALNNGYRFTQQIQTWVY